MANITEDRESRDKEQKRYSYKPSRYSQKGQAHDINAQVDAKLFPVE